VTREPLRQLVDLDEGDTGAVVGAADGGGVEAGIEVDDQRLLIRAAGREGGERA
jgi:hypothetical protein